MLTRKTHEKVLLLLRLQGDLSKKIRHGTNL